MRIQEMNRKINDVMSLDNGDIFKYGEDYYIAGDVNLSDFCRECYNLSQNHVTNIYHNPVVQYWHGTESILSLCDKES